MLLTDSNVTSFNEDDGQIMNSLRLCLLLNGTTTLHKALKLDYRQNKLKFETEWNEMEKLNVDRSWSQLKDT